MVKQGEKTGDFGQLVLILNGFDFLNPFLEKKAVKKSIGVFHSLVSSVLEVDYSGLICFYFLEVQDQFKNQWF